METVSGNLGQNHVNFGLYSRSLWPWLFIYFMCRRELSYVLNAVLAILWAHPTKSIPCEVNPVSPVDLSFLCHPDDCFYPSDTSSSSKQLLTPMCSFSKTCRKESAHHSPGHGLQYQPSGGHPAEVGVPVQETLLQVHRYCLSQVTSSCLSEVSSSWNVRVVGGVGCEGTHKEKKV